VIISDDEICELEPVSQDVLVVMTQPAYDKYISRLKPNGTLIYDRIWLCPIRIQNLPLSPSMV